MPFRGKREKHLQNLVALILGINSRSIYYLATFFRLKNRNKKSTRIGRESEGKIANRKRKYRLPTFLQ